MYFVLLYQWIALFIFRGIEIQILRKPNVSSLPRDSLEPRRAAPGNKRSITKYLWNRPTLAQNAHDKLNY